MDLIKLIRETEGVSAFKVVDKAEHRAEAYYVKRKLETVRAIDVEETSVTVYVEHDDAMGDSTFPVFASMDEEAVRAALKLAVERAYLVSNKPYALPKGGVEMHELPSDLVGQDLRKVASQVAQAVFEVPMGEGGSINALEIFVTRETKRVRTGEGLDKTQVTHYIGIEAIPTSTDDKESVELYEWYDLTDLDLDRIRKEIADKMIEVRARKDAEQGKPMTIDVALRPSEITDLFFELTYELNYGPVFQHANAYNVGDDLQKDGDGDPLNVTLRAEVRGSCMSAAFDGDGAPLRDCQVIKDGKFVSMWGSTRYGAYLGLKPEEITGNLPCFEVGTGTLDKPQGDWLECVSLSGLQLDVDNDYIGGEIRLAYLHQGDKVTPITGISMSGQLSKVLPSIRLSKDKVVRGAYQGPSLAVLKDVQIV